MLHSAIRSKSRTSSSISQSRPRSSQVKPKSVHKSAKISPQYLPKRAVSTKTSNPTQADVEINGRLYNRPKMGVTYVGICFDGTNMDYITEAMNAGKMPHLQRITTPPPFETIQAIWKQQRVIQEKRELQNNGIIQEENAKNAENAENVKNVKNVNFFQSEGVIALAAGAFPTFTNPNNVSIITGVSPLHHGVCGNFYYNEAEDKNVTMTDPKLIRSDSILATMYKLDPEHTKVTIITSKDKLKRMLLHQLPDSNYLGSELPSLHSIHSKAGHEVTKGEPIPSAQQNSGPINSNIRAVSIEALNVLHELGQQYVDLVNQTFNQSQLSGFAPVAHNSKHSTATPTSAPSIYQPNNSSYALRLGYSFFKKDQQEGFKGANLFYISTTDYVQHLHAPGTPEANSLLSEFDEIISRFHDDGALVGFTADHGMNQKTNFKGEPDIVFLESHLDSLNIASNVILPITDPYVAHHGALGGYATIYIKGDKSNPDAPLQDTIDKACNHLRKIKGCYSVIGRQDATRGLDLPGDRIGDIVVLGDKQSVFGTKPENHDLSQLHGKVLRSHGSLEESLVPLFYNRPLKKFFAKDFGKGNVRNFDLFYGLFTEMETDNTHL